MAIIARTIRCKYARILPAFGGRAAAALLPASSEHQGEISARAGLAVRIQGGFDEMLRLKYAPLVLAVLAVIALPAEWAAAQYRSSSAYGTSGVQAPSISGINAPAAISQEELALPPVNVPKTAADQFESNPILSIPGVFVDQWSPSQQIAPESLISERYIRSADDSARKITLKQAIYIAIRNNPALKASELDPIASTEGVREANAAFDPDLTSQLDIIKDVAPTSSALQAPGSDAFTQKITTGISVRPQSSPRPMARSA